MELIDEMKNRLRYAMTKRNLAQVDICKRTGIEKSLLNKYLSGTSNAKQDKIAALARALDVNEVWLMGYDAPMQRDIKNYTINVYSSVHAGIPTEMIENIVDTEDISEEMLKSDKEYFGLKIKGNSMYPKYMENDTIIVERCSDVESGTDCVVAVNGEEAFLKKLIKKDDSIILQAYNSDYLPIVITNEKITILGKVIEIRRKI